MAGYNTYKPGDPWCICDRCGFRVRYSETRLTWDGLRVCLKDWEPRHPQLDVRARPERVCRLDLRPEPEPLFIEPDEGYVDPRDLRYKKK